LSGATNRAMAWSADVAVDGLISSRRCADGRKRAGRVRPQERILIVS